jgi:hypothetical protein
MERKSWSHTDKISRTVTYERREFRSRYDDYDDHTETERRGYNKRSGGTSKKSRKVLRNIWILRTM